MRPTITVIVSDVTGIPYARVPCGCVWDLMGYLSDQNAHVHYDFKATHFTVAFPKDSPTEAQSILEQWAQECSHEMAGAV